MVSGLAIDGPELFLETLEQIVAVVWSRRGFGVVLDTKRIFAAVTDAGDCLVIQVTVRHFEAIWQRIILDGKAMVLRGDFHLAGFQVEHRLIDAPVTKFQLERLRTTSE